MRRFILETLLFWILSAPVQAQSTQVSHVCPPDAVPEAVCSPDAAPKALPQAQAQTSPLAITFEGLDLANNLVNACESAKVSDQRECLNYVNGAMSMQGALTALLAIRFDTFNKDWINLVRNYMVCSPAQATLGQLIKIFTKYMRDHPEDLHRSSAFMLMVSWKTAFPCEPLK